MIILGLTGSIGMGKSTVAAMFVKLGVPVFDADATVHALQAPGGKALALIEEQFPGTTGHHGLDRMRLGRLVFEDATALRRLERILHPLVNQERGRFIKRHRRHELVILDIPLLFEGGGWKHCDATVVVSAPARVQRARVLARPGMTEAKLRSILSHQVPDAEKRRRADFVISTGLGLRRTRREVRQLVACLRHEGLAACRARLGCRSRRFLRPRAAPAAS